MAFVILPWNDGPASGTPASVSRGPRRWEQGIYDAHELVDDERERNDAQAAALAALSAQNQKGTTAERQAAFPAEGSRFYDTTLHKPFWGDGAAWRDADGTVDTGGGGGGGGVGAISGFAAEVVSGGTIGQINLSWPAITGATAITIRETRSPTGVSGMPLAGSATSNSRTPSTSGTYDYWLTYTKDGVESPASNVASVTLPYVAPGGGGGGTPTDSPAAVLNIGPLSSNNHFDVGIGRPGQLHENITQQRIIDGFSEQPYFYVKDSSVLTGTPVVNFSMYANGSTTSINTEQARSELREYAYSASSTTVKAAWNAPSGTHRMSGKSRITHLPSNGTRPWVCFAQIHGAKEDMCRVQVETPTGDGGFTNLRIRANTHEYDSDTAPETKTIIQSSYTIGQEIDWMIEVINGIGKIYLGGVVKWTWPISSLGNYFKAGLYNQFNTTTKGGYPGSEYASIELRDLDVFHS